MLVQIVKLSLRTFRSFGERRLTGERSAVIAVQLAITVATVQQLL